MGCAETKKCRKCKKTKTAKKKKSVDNVLEKNSYVGIIDTEGLDMFQRLTPQAVNIATIRAQCNPQRHAKVFMAVFEEGHEPTEHISKVKDPWDKWDYINMACIELRCRPEDVKTVNNIKKIANLLKETT